jgi:hypothetical protein
MITKACPTIEKYFIIKEKMHLIAVIKRDAFLVNVRRSGSLLPASQALGLSPVANGLEAV